MAETLKGMLGREASGTNPEAGEPESTRIGARAIN